MKYSLRSTLEIIYNLSGIPYSSVNKINSSHQAQSRSQIDARALQSRWSTPINYYINTKTGFTSSIIANSTKYLLERKKKRSLTCSFDDICSSYCYFALGK